MKEPYRETKDSKGNVTYDSRKLCPLGFFGECIGKKCAFYSYTDFTNEDKKLVNVGECALFKLPVLLIDLKNILTEK